MAVRIKSFHAINGFAPSQVYTSTLGENRISIQQQHDQDEQPDFGGKGYTFSSERLRRKELGQTSLKAKLHMPQNTLSLKKARDYAKRNQPEKDKYCMISIPQGL